MTSSSTTTTNDSATHSSPKRKAKVWRSRTQWKALLDEWAISGLSKAAFCEQHGIGSSSLHKWQKVFAESSNVAGFIDITEPLAKTPLAVAVQSGDGLWQVELELGAGVVLRVRAH